jgi:hypothetical protein
LQTKRVNCKSTQQSFLGPFQAFRNVIYEEVKTVSEMANTIEVDDGRTMYRRCHSQVAHQIRTDHQMKFTENLVLVRLTRHFAASNQAIPPAG